MSEWIPIRRQLIKIIKDCIPLSDEIEVKLRFILQQCVVSILANSIIKAQELQIIHENLVLKRIEVSKELLNTQDPFAGLKLLKEMNLIVNSKNQIEENFLIQEISHQLLIDLIDLKKNIFPLYRWILETWRYKQILPNQFSNLFTSEGLLEKNIILRNNIFAKTLHTIGFGDNDFFNNYEIVTRAFFLIEKGFENNLISKDLVSSLNDILDECAISRGCEPENLTRLAEEVLSPSPRHRFQA